MGRIAEWGKRIGRYFWVALVAALTVAVGVLKLRRDAEAVGEARGRAEKDRERLDEQRQQGDGGGIYRDLTGGRS